MRGDPPPDPPCGPSLRPHQREHGPRKAGRRMSGMRKAGFWVLGVAAVLWVVVVVATVTTSVDEGANIGAGMLFLLALPCTVTGVVLIGAGSRPSPQPWGAPPGSPHPGGTLLAAPIAPVVPSASGSDPAGWGLALGIAGILAGW